MTSVPDLTLTLLSCSASQSSQSRRCLSVLVRILSAEGVTTKILDIRGLPPVWVCDQSLAQYPTPYQEAYREVEASHGVVLLGPVYGYSAGSPMKAFTEIIGDALHNKPVAFVSASGSPKSFLALRDLMTSLMLEHAAICFPDTVQVSKDLYRPAADILLRLSRFARNFALFCQSLRPFCHQKEID